MINRNSGFTLLELMMVVAISGILLMVGIPSFRSMIATSELTSTTNDLLASLKKARGRAISSGHTASVCSSDDGATCKGSAGFWSDGWIVWVDLNDNTTFEANELEWVVEIDSDSSVNITPSLNFALQIDFKYDGNLLQAVAGDFKVCSGQGPVPATDGYPQRLINLAVLGEPQLTRLLATKC